ncbi:TPA: DUF551 domain-containing protein [Escherichia coli]|nr:DUF551 domain-containing protein [Escherichia coli]
MTTFTDKELIKEIKERIGSLDVRDNIERRAYEIALASLEAEPVAWTDEEELRDVRKYGFGEIFQCPPDKYADPRRVISLYRELPAPVVPDDWQLVPKKITLEMECALSKADSYEIGWLWALAAAPKYEVQNAKRVQNALNACRAAMLHGSEPVSQAYKLPPMSSNAVNDAAWKLHNMLTEHGPLNGCQFNNLKECFYEALKVAMRNFPVIPDSWISCSDRMPDKLIPVIVMYEDGEMWSAMWNGNRWDDGTEYPDPHSVTHWSEMPAAPQQEVNRG